MTWKLPPPARRICMTCHETMPNVDGVSVCKRCVDKILTPRKRSLQDFKVFFDRTGMEEDDGSIQVGSGRG